MNPMLTMNQKHTIDTQKLERKEHKPTTKGNYQTTREETKRRKEHSILFIHDKNSHQSGYRGNISQQNKNHL